MLAFILGFSLVGVLVSVFCAAPAFFFPVGGFCAFGFIVFGIVSVVRSARSAAVVPAAPSFVDTLPLVSSASPEPPPLYDTPPSVRSIRIDPMQDLEPDSDPLADLETASFDDPFFFQDDTFILMERDGVIVNTLTGEIVSIPESQPELPRIDPKPIAVVLIP